MYFKEEDKIFKQEKEKEKNESWLQKLILFPVSLEPAKLH